MSGWTDLGLRRPVFLVAVFALIVGAAPPEAWAQKTIPFAEARIFIEYNFTDNDLGFHVSLDAQDWKKVEIVAPNGDTIFMVDGGSFGKRGITGLFFEGAEPPLTAVSLCELLSKFPEGQYEFIGTTVDDARLRSTAKLTHAVPAAPDKVSVEVGDGNKLIISWKPGTGQPPDPNPGDGCSFPKEPIKIVGYQVIVDSFEVTVPASVTSVTVSPEFVGSLKKGEHGFEVLAIEAGGNQTIFGGTLTIR